MNVIELRKCSFSYDNERPIFKDVSFHLKKGEVLGILGCNGVGKSSLLKCISGILKWQEGECLLNGKKNYNKAKTIGYVAQSKRLSFSFRVRDLVCFGRNAVTPYFASPSKVDYQITDEILEELQISHLANKLCNQLSGGEFQMVFIAKALVAHPQLLLLDEPETSLDIKNLLMLTDKLVELAKKYQTTIIINSHDLNNMMRIADKCLLLGTSDYLFESPSKISEKDISNYLGVQSKQIVYTENNHKSSYFILNSATK